MEKYLHSAKKYLDKRKKIYKLQKKKKDICAAKTVDKKLPKQN